MATAAAGDQARLLEVQALDTKLHQLAHRRAALPAAVRLTELRTILTRARQDAAGASAATGDIRREIKRIEDEVAKVDERTSRDKGHLEAGHGQAKDLVALQGELNTLARRRGELEDTELEVMERLETAEKAERILAAAVEEVGRQEREMAAQVVRELEQIEAEQAGLAHDRAELTTDLDAGLLALYERLRGQLGGVGAAQLRQGRCEGCRLQLNVVDLSEIRKAPPDQVVRCQECGRILVRLADSGL